VQPAPEVQPPPAPTEPRPLTPIDVLGPEPPAEIKPEQTDDVLKVVAHNIFPDLNEEEAKQLADRTALLSARNLETERFRYELQKFLPPDVPYPFGPTTRLMQAYNAFREGPTTLTALELQRAQDAFNAVAGPRAPVPGALKLPIMWREVEARFPEVLPPPVPVTREDVARRAYEISADRERTGQPGNGLSDWTRAQQQLSQTREPLPSTQGESEPWISSIANRFTAERQATGQLGEVAPGEGASTEALLTRGLRMGPEQINQHVSDLMAGRGDPVAQASAIRAEEARLSQRSNAASRALDADPTNQALKVAQDNAFKDLTDFHNGPVAKLKNNWHATGMGLQGELPVDLSTFNGLREAFLRDNGKAPAPEMEQALRKTAQKVRDATAANNGAMQKLGAEIERQTVRRKIPTADEVRLAIMERMKDMPCPR